MTPEERQMIAGLFDRMRSFGAPDKDKDAEAIINEAVRSTPDAPYMLVQSVLVQEHALQQAGNRIKDLEEQVHGLQPDVGQARPPGSGNFLGGLLGGGRPVSQPGASSVPVIGSRPPAPPAYDQDERRPWSQSPPQQSGPMSGGFLRSAMATAAGVAGGMLAAGAIRDLMGGTANTNTAAANAPAATNASSGADTASTTTNASAEQTQQDWEQDVRQDASDDGSSWGDFGSDDLDI